MTIYAFTLRLLETGSLAGQAVVCAEARYASAWWRGADRPDRRPAPVREWLAVDAQLAEKLPPGPLARTSAIGQLLAGGRGTELTIQYLYQEPLPAGLRPEHVALELDQRLRVVQA